MTNNMQNFVDILSTFGKKNLKKLQHDKINSLKNKQQMSCIGEKVLQKFLKY